MILVQNLLRPLSGNKALLFLLICSVLFALGCTPKTTSGNPDRPVIKEQPTKRVYNPETGRYEEVSNVQKLDTVQTKQAQNDKVIIDKDYGKDEEIHKSNYIKTSYRLALLLPMDPKDINSSNFVSGADMEYLQYYAGLQLAAHKWMEAGLDISLDVINIGKTGAKVPDLIQGNQLRNYDVIIGAEGRNNIKKLRDFASNQELLYISPWKNVSGSESNPFFVQLEPSILNQFDYISEYVFNEYKKDEVVIIVKKGDENRLAPFQKRLREMTDSGQSFQELIVDDETFDLADTDLTQYLNKQRATAFIVPYTSGSFLNKILSKIKGAKEENLVHTYGLHSWIDLDIVDMDLYETLNIRLCSWYYPRYDKEEYSIFVDAYYDDLGILPQSNEVFSGFDQFNFICQNLFKYGTEVARYGGNDGYEGILHSIKIDEVISDDSRKSGTDYFENGALQIIMLKEGRYMPID